MHPLGYFASAPNGTLDAAILSSLVSRYGEYLEQLSSEQKLALRAVLSYYLFYKLKYVSNYSVREAITDAMPEYTEASIRKVILTLEGISSNGAEGLIKFLTDQRIEGTVLVGKAVGEGQQLLTSRLQKEIQLVIRLSGQAAQDLEALTLKGKFHSLRATAEHIINCFVSPLCIGWQRAQPSFRLMPLVKEAGLRPKQIQALELLAMGQTDIEVARAVGVGRETVNRWRHQDPNFRAILEKRLDHLRVSAELDDKEEQIIQVLKKYLPKKHLQSVLHRVTSG